MVISQRERVIDEVTTLLDNYRSALKNSKRRMSPELDPEGYETMYYRMPTVVARDLHKLLPKLIEKDTWVESDTAIEGAKGTIQICRSVSLPLKAVTDTEKKMPSEAYSVLIIHQKRRVHPQITELIGKIESGDAPGFGGMRSIGGMGGMF